MPGSGLCPHFVGPRRYAGSGEAPREGGLLPGSEPHFAGVLNESFRTSEPLNDSFKTPDPAPQARGSAFQSRKVT
jgi:hypothetical protein